MLMRRVCAIALNTQAIEHGHTHGTYKISVGSSTYTRLAQVEIEHGCERTRPLVKFFNFVSSFERRSIDFSADDQLGALVEWFQVENLVLQPATKFRGTETQINLSAGFSRPDVRMGTAVKGAHRDGCSLLQIVHRMQSHGLPRQFQHGANAFFRIETGVGCAPMNGNRKHSRSLPGRLNAASTRRRFEHQRRVCTKNLRFDQTAPGGAAILFIAGP